ncbi:MAG: hypothetical protein K2K97_11750, partial [Muribaculaceae bacterium]|nr:hypothetical protein [Muribaculaceae bacterium]
NNDIKKRRIRYHRRLTKESARINAYKTRLQTLLTPTGLLSDGLQTQNYKNIIIYANIVSKNKIFTLANSLFAK